MYTKQSELYCFQQIKEKICRLRADIWFLSRCKRFKRTPKFIDNNFKSQGISHIGQKSMDKAKLFWLNEAINEKYSLLAAAELTAYNLHQNLSFRIAPLVWNELLKRITAITANIMYESMCKKRRKFKCLGDRIEANLKKSEFIPNFIVNKSDYDLSENEMRLLNYGLNFALPPKSPPLEQQIVDIEIALNRIDCEYPDGVRNRVKHILTSSKLQKPQSNSTVLHDAVKSLNAKDIFITKADKGNSIIVLNKNDYNAGIEKMIDDGNYKKVKNPLPKMQTEVNNIRKKYRNLFGTRWSHKMNKSNSRVPCIYGLFKQHKPGNSYRPIIAGYSAPIANIAKWLSEFFGRLKHFDDFSVKNSFDLVKKLKPIEIKENEELVSFDIKSFFSNVPRTGALNALREWLERQELDQQTKLALFELTELCVKQSFFQFRGDFYQQDDGLPMGLNISPFICNLYMITVEEKVRHHSLFPRLYYRYVDDCAAIVKTEKVTDTLNLLNSICSEIQFTCEREVDGKLPFLDLKLIRNGENIEFDIYRKPTHTDRVIPIESYHHRSHKLAAFNSMFHRLFNIPLTKLRFETEKKNIYRIAHINGYAHKVIDQLFKKHQRKKATLSTSLSSEKCEPIRCALSFDTNTFDRLNNIFTHVNACFAAKSGTKLKSMLRSTKDEWKDDDKPGVYKASCSHVGCDAVYIGQSTRSMSVREKEHRKYIRNIEPHRSGLAEHILNNRHSLNDNAFKLIASESNPQRLNILESLHIYLNRKTNVNRDIGPHFSSLFGILN